MTQSNLLTYVAHHKWKLVKLATNYVAKSKKHLMCESTKKNLFLYSSLLEELESYYKGCSCLTENEMCEILNLLNNI